LFINYALVLAKHLAVISARFLVRQLAQCLINQSYYLLKIINITAWPGYYNLIRWILSPSMLQQKQMCACYGVTYIILACLYIYKSSQINALDGIKFMIDILLMVNMGAQTKRQEARKIEFD
jgi:hypothetical protein